MHFSISTIATVAALISSISCHLIMDSPKQWKVKVIDNPDAKLGEGPQNPLLESGANYPCQGAAPEAPVATYAPGSMQPLKLLGSAVHGGGSGQMSITYETTPTKATKFRVMTSWMGGHPLDVPGNLPPNAALDLTTQPGGNIQFKVPAGLPAGKAVVAWTWFNRVGNREMYMKCATIMIGGAEKSTAAFDALPEMFRANSGNGCIVPEGIKAIKFKNPGPYTVGTGITPIDCDKTQPGTGGGSGGGSGSSPSPVPTKASTKTTSKSKTKTKTKSKATSTSAPTRTSSPNKPEKPDNKPGPAPAPTPTPTPAPAAPGAACVEGAITCNSDGTWSQCGSGLNQNMGKVAAGMKCNNGKFSKRSVRFSHDHRRRHQHN